MLKLEIIAAGRLKSGPLAELSDEYVKRIRWPLTLHEIESKHKDPAAIQADETEKIMQKLSPDTFIIVLDERGKGLRSLDFAQTLLKLQDTGVDKIQFVIGGADGLTEGPRKRANLLLSFGQQTWPHMLARVMLLEQIYRAQQIIAGHPYHRE